jgi:alpha-L-rhamnosidase
MPILLVLGIAVSGVGGLMHPIDLTCEFLRDPVGIDVAQPRLSWKLKALNTKARGLRQTAYRIVVASSSRALAGGKGDLWDTGKVESNICNLVTYGGPALKSRNIYFWKVKCWDQDGKESDWSKPARWSVGLLNATDWKAKWLGFETAMRPAPVIGNSEHPYPDWVQNRPAPIFRRAFKAKAKVKSAVASVCGVGFYELRLNGKKIGDHELDPPFTRYDKRCLYATYDVTKRIKQGENALGMLIGNGWFDVNENEEWNFLNAHWRAKPRFILNLHLTYSDGSVEDVSTDDKWKATHGPIQRDAIRNGEFYDARKEQPGWDAPGFDDSRWQAVEVVEGPKGVLRSLSMPPVKVMQTRESEKITEPKAGEYVLDYGQNIAGRCILNVKAKAGTEIVIRYGERLAADGTLDQKLLKLGVYAGPIQEERYIASGKGMETWHSRFTYSGFRYVQVSGLPAKPTQKTLIAQVLHTAFEDTGTFECSNTLLNDVVRLTRWAYKGNYLGIPTDCPHREKNGWTGDAHVISETAQFLFENTAAYEKWMNDFKDEQPPAGDFPGIIPNPGWGYGIGPAWDSAYIIIPWNLYLYRGDKGVLEEHYEGMKRFVDCLAGRAKGFIIDYGLPDWLPPKTGTPTAVTSTGYFYYDAKTLARIASLLGHEEDVERYTELAANIRKAFVTAFLQPDGKIGEGSQAAQACALFFGLVDSNDAKKVASVLASNVEAYDGHLDVGFHGNRWLFAALSDQGRHDLAYRVATQTTFPSVGFMLKSGATTIWEDWYANNSLNHVAFGCVVGWYYTHLAGIQIDPAKPGFAHFTVRPQPVGDLKWVRAKTMTPHGEVSVSWRLDKAFTLEVVVPPNSTATVWVPASDASSVTEGGRSAAAAPGVRSAGMKDGAALFEVGSGTYEFTAAAPRE